jgi:large conductance mechanosensitive channel
MTTGGTVRKLLTEYKDFINKGNVIAIAVGLVMALYFQKIVDALLNGVINPIIAAIFGERSFEDVGFDIGDARISIGLVIDAVISFLVVGFILFWIVKLYNEHIAKQSQVTGDTEMSVLKEIRDELRSGAR